MKTNLNNIWQKYTWQNLQQNYMQQMWDLFVERRYFKFQNEIQFSSNSTRICAAEMAVRYAALAEKYTCVIVIR